MASMNNERIETPLRKAKGLGSARGGLHHWMHERISSVAAIPLTLWLVWAVISMPGWSHTEFTTWLALPWNAVLMMISIATIFYHTSLGIQVIVEDYVHREGSKLALMYGFHFFFAATGAVCIFSILKIAFTAGV